MPRIQFLAVSTGSHLTPAKSTNPVHHGWLALLLQSERHAPFACGPFPTHVCPQWCWTSTNLLVPTDILTVCGCDVLTAKWVHGHWSPFVLFEMLGKKINLCQQQQQTKTPCHPHTPKVQSFGDHDCMVRLEKFSSPQLWVLFSL